MQLEHWRLTAEGWSAGAAPLARNRPARASAVLRVRSGERGRLGRLLWTLRAELTRSPPLPGVELPEIEAEWLTLDEASARR